MPEATYLRTDTVPLADLTPFPGNAKRGNVPVILESLCANGQYRSVIVREHDGQLTILAGNHTTQAIAAHGPGDCGLTIKRGGEEEPCALCGNSEWAPVVRCEIVTCDDDTARRLNLVDNKSSDDGSYDQEALAALLGNLGDDYTGTGYGDTDLEDLLAAIDEAAQDDAEPEDDSPPPAAPTGSGLSGGEGGGEGDGSGEDGNGHITLTYAPAARDEAARLIAAVTERAFPGADPSTVVLSALRAFAAALEYRGRPDERVPLAVLMDAAAGRAV
jgi:hypothetical protein